MSAPLSRRDDARRAGVIPVCLPRSASGIACCGTHAGGRMRSSVAGGPARIRCENAQRTRAGGRPWVRPASSSGLKFSHLGRSSFGRRGRLRPWVRRVSAHGGRGRGGPYRPPHERRGVACTMRRHRRSAAYPMGFPPFTGLRNPGTAVGAENNHGSCGGLIVRLFRWGSPARTPSGDSGKASIARGTCG